MNNNNVYTEIDVIYRPHVFDVPFRLIGIHFNHRKNETRIYIGSIGYIHDTGDLSITVGSEDPLQKFFKGHIFKRGQV